MLPKLVKAQLLRRIHEAAEVRSWGIFMFVGMGKLLPLPAAFVHAKGVLVVVDNRFLSTDEIDFDDVETRRDVVAFEKTEPVSQTAAQQFAFSSVYSAHGGTAGRGGRALYLAGYEGVSLAAHDVDFAASSFTEVAVEHLVAMSPQVGGRYQLTIFSEVGGGGRGVRVPGAAPFVQQVQTSGDGVA